MLHPEPVVPIATCNWNVIKAMEPQCISLHFNAGYHLLCPELVVHMCDVADSSGVWQGGLCSVTSLRAASK